MPIVGVHIIHGNIEILSEFSKSGCVLYMGAYYTRKLMVKTRYGCIPQKKKKKKNFFCQQEMHMVWQVK